jgi:ketosteroid isomerase-like protein
MSEENVEVVRECADTFNAFMRGEVTEEAATEVAQRVLGPQFEYHWHSRRGMFPDQPQHVRGFPAFIAFWKQARGAFVDLVMEPLEFIEAPNDRVLTPTRQTGRGRESGVPVEGRFFQVWTLRDGKVREVEFFLRRADALEAAGLRE